MKMRKLAVLLVIVAFALMAFTVQAVAADTTSPMATKIELYKSGASAPFRTLDADALEGYYDDESGEYDIDDLYVPASAKITVKVTTDESIKRVYIDSKQADKESSRVFSYTITAPRVDIDDDFLIELGGKGSDSEKTYKVTWKGTNDSADLSRLSLKAENGSKKSVSLYPSFSKNYYGEYFALIPYNSSGYDTLIFDIAASSGADITINGDSIDGNKDTAYEYDLDGDDEVITITVENGDMTREYTLNVYHSNDNSKDCELDDLFLEADGDDVKLSPKFKSGTTSYTASVDEDVEEATIGFEAEDDYCKVLVRLNDSAVVCEYEDEVYVELEEGKNEIEITVFAGNYSTTETYTVNLYRGESDNNYLSGLALKSSSGANISINPNFSETTTTYTANVANSVNQIAAKAILQDSEATLRINSATVNDDTWSNYISLNEGVNTIKFAVTAQDGTIRTYQVNVTREASPKKNLSLYIGKNTAYVGSSAVVLDAAPFLYKYGVNNYTMVPIRFIGEQGLGANVHWNSVTKSVSISKGGTTINMTLGKANPAIGLDCPPMIKNNRTFVPIRYVATQLDCIVNYTGIDQPITINPR
ncbi:MAG: cadherin-like beta sandwich domain-containing protein [Bacillota bacterium]|jgi:hypothetical protein